MNLPRCDRGGRDASFFFSRFTDVRSRVPATAGCDAVHIDLAERGILGNSHGSMFERNNAEVLAVVTDWMDAQLD